MPIHSQHSLSLIVGRGRGQSKFTLIELLVVLLVLGILMAIAIPLISGARQAANNSKCRSNLVQLHTAIISHAKSNDDFILENLAFNNDLTVLIDNGYLDENSKLTDCPGEDGKQNPRDSSYVGGEKLDGINHLLALTDNDIILSDKSETHHKAGKNAIHLDGSFRQTSGGTLIAKNNIIPRRMRMNKSSRRMNKKRLTKTYLRQLKMVM